MENYDTIINREFSKKIIDYGIMEGNNTILLIKVGQNGNIYGFENKYLNIAMLMNKKYGYTVITASNPFDGQNPLDNDTKVVEEYCQQKAFDDYVIHYMGHSNGAIIGLTWGYKYPQIKKMLLINAPLMVNWHKSKAGIEQSKEQEISLIYGEKDPSSFYTRHFNPLMERNQQIKLMIVKDADHNFKGMLDEFIRLPDTYLGDD